MKQLVKLLIIVTLSSTLCFAQGRRGGFGGGRGRGGPVQMDEQIALNLFAALLNLTDSQQQQLRTAFDAAVKTAAPIAAQMESNKEALFETVKAGKNDDQIKGISEQQGSLTSQMLALQAQTFSKMWTLLTGDQKSQVDATMYGDIGEFLANAKQPLPPPSTVASPGGPPK